MGSVFVASASLFGQEETTAEETVEEDEEIETLSPFTVDANEQTGYLATSTLAGTRIKTNLSDVGSAISVMTTEFMQDLSGNDNESLLSYMVNSEVGGPRGNFSGGVDAGNPRELGLFGNPNNNTRIRGLSSADNTRNFFRTDIPWDNYNVDRVDLQRGPNAILFGLGSPAGVVNASTNQATFDTFGRAVVRFDQFASFRTALDYNYEILEDELAVRASLLVDRQKFRQDPAFEDDDRLYVAVKYAPRQLNSDSVRFELRGSYEIGGVEANRPRSVTIQDKISGWFLPETDSNGNPLGGLNKRTFGVYTDMELKDTNLDTGILGQINTFVEGSGPWYNSNAFQDGTWARIRVANNGHLTSDGQVINENDINGSVFFRDQRRVVVMKSADRAGAIEAPFFTEGFYQDATIQDPSIFDFYNNLMDGPNKRSFRDWNAFELELTNTFWNDRIGYNIGYFNQQLDTERWGIMGFPVESGYALNIDINSTTFQNLPNPDAGRPYLNLQPSSAGTGTGVTNRDALRAQAFVELDSREWLDGFLGDIIGLHRFTGLYATDNRDSDNRSHKLWDYAPEAYTNDPNVSITQDSIDNSINYYLGPSLTNASSPAGANIGRINEFIIPSTGTRNITVWDPTWIADPSVNPGDPWAGVPTRSHDTQAENPANYRGWVQRPTEVVSFIDRGNGNFYAGQSALDYLATSGTLVNEEIESFVAVWQGYLWNDSIVGTFGYRKDKAENTQFRAEPKPDGYPGHRGAFLHPDRYNLDDPQNFDPTWGGPVLDELEVETKNWSVALHLHRVLGPRYDDLLPVNLSLYYNEGENFQPAAGRFDAFGEPLPPPGGKTEDISALIATKDNRFSFRITKYETSVQNQRATGNIRELWRLQQAIFQPAWGKVRMQRGQWDIDSYTGTNGPDYMRNTIIPAWEEFELALLQEFPLVTRWSSTGEWPINDIGVTFRPPVGMTFTEDAISKGWEYEFIANPLPNWRISLNASQTEAIRDNVPGESFLALSSFIDEWFMNTPAGEMPYWWINSPPVRDGALYVPYRGQWLTLLSLNGQPQPEIREWRFNGVTNYTFTEGRLKGLGVGSGFRWLDKYAVDFPPTTDENGTVVRDLENPYLADSEFLIDLWASYVFNITDDIRWRIQLNVYNAFGNNKLIPLNTDPFGNPQAVRIQEGRSWAITNTIDF